MKAALRLPLEGKDLTRGVQGYGLKKQDKPVLASLPGPTGGLAIGPRERPQPCGGYSRQKEEHSWLH